MKEDGRRGLDAMIRWVPEPGFFDKSEGRFRIVGAAESEKKFPKTNTTIRQRGAIPAIMPPPPGSAADDAATSEKKRAIPGSRRQSPDLFGAQR